MHLHGYTFSVLGIEKVIILLHTQWTRHETNAHNICHWFSPTIHICKRFKVSKIHCRYQCCCNCKYILHSIFSVQSLVKVLPLIVWRRWNSKVFWRETWGTQSTKILWMSRMGAMWWFDLRQITQVGLQQITHRVLYLPCIYSMHHITWQTWASLIMSYIVFHLFFKIF